MHQDKIRKVNISETCQGARVDNCSLRAVQSVIGSSDDTTIRNRPRGNISRRKNDLPMTKKKTRVLRFKTLIYLRRFNVDHYSGKMGFRPLGMGET